MSKKILLFIYVFICCCFQIRSRSIWIKDVDFRFDNYYLFCSKNIFEYTLETLFGFWIITYIKMQFQCQLFLLHLIYAPIWWKNMQSFQMRNMISFNFLHHNTENKITFSGFLKTEIAINFIHLFDFFSTTWYLNR